MVCYNVITMKKREAETSTKGDAMTREQMIEAAVTELEKEDGYRYSTPDLEAAVDAGLQDGDKVALGGKLVAHIHGDKVAMVNKGTETARMALASLTQEQQDRMLVLKAARAGYRGTSTGRAWA